jgi:hypothetical protein
MELSLSMIFITGVLLGSAGMLGALHLGRRRRTRLQNRDPLYAAACYAAMVHVHRYGKVHIPVVAHALNIPDMTAERYLDLMTHEGLVSRHGRPESRFYTRA